MRSVYIHIPFCKRICSYCDFCKMFYDSSWARPYLKKLSNEIENYYMDDNIRTIYIGGGTPSALSLQELEYLLNLTKKFKKMKNIEFTFECNLEDINMQMLKLLKFYNVTRLSIGIQSFIPHLQDLLGRHHEFKDAKEKINLARSLGFDNISLDLMYGFYNETLDDLRKDLKLFLKLKPDHISTYSLILEDHTLLKVNNIPKLDEEDEALMYETLSEILIRSGFNHYEISNFARKGYESIHNLNYWENGEYYGFGLGASGYVDKVRYTNTRNFFKYITEDFRSEEKILSQKEIMDNEIMLGLRKTKGINVNEFKNKYHVNIEDVYPIKPLIKNKELKQKKEYIFIPEDKLYVMNEILLKMI